MHRLYDTLAKKHLHRYRQMLFLAGPRQVGKTTCSLGLSRPEQRLIYLNWDIVDHRRLLTGDLKTLEEELALQQLTNELPLIIFDEIHKYHMWKTFLKGFFDVHGQRVKVVVTGSARLNTYRVGGDSLMGRYLLYRMHPLSLGEILAPEPIDQELRQPVRSEPNMLERLVEFGGFPEPYTLQDKAFVNQWRRLRHQQLFREDLRDLSQVHEIALVEVLADLLRRQVGQLTAYSQLAKKIGVTGATIKRWLATLRALYYCFPVRPWAKNVTRSLIKEPKYYLYDWSLIEDRGARIENLVASHLLKAVQWWTDRGFGDYELRFVRDKEKREVDFLVTRNDQPWFLVEVKAGRKNGLSKSLNYFKQELGVPHAFQVVLDLDFVERDCFSVTDPVIVPMTTLLSQLP